MLKSKIALSVALLATVLIGCSSNYADDEPKLTRAEAQQEQENSEEDLCDVLAFYDDGTCDDWCLEDDDDCTDSAERCGENICSNGQVCCNESCGICADPDEACTTQYCGGEDEPGQPGPGDPEPEPGEVECGDVLCGDGQVCCNESCGICTAPDEACIQIGCAEAPDDDGDDDPNDPNDPDGDDDDGDGDDDGDHSDPNGGADCNTVTCGEGQVCCNFSCSICTEPDEACTQQLCE